MESDQLLAHRVRQQLKADRRLAGNRIDIAVKNGVVRLKACFDDEYRKLDAELAVMRVDGIDGLVIADQAMKSGQDDAATPSSETVRFLSAQGASTPEPAASDPRADAASASGTSTLRHAQLQSAVDAALARLAHRETGNIVMTISGTTVKLEGPVASWIERGAIVHAVRTAPGVTTVDDHLTVMP